MCKTMKRIGLILEKTLGMGLTLVGDAVKMIVSFFFYMAVMVCVLALAAKEMKLWVNESDVNRARYFLQVEHWTPKRNDYAVVDCDCSNQRSIQRVVGVAGDVIRVDKYQHVFVNEQWVFVTSPQAFEGKTLSAIGSQKIPEGSVFLYGGHAESFDSRYAQCGLFKVKALKGRAFSLW